MVFTLFFLLIALGASIAVTAVFGNWAAFLSVNAALAAVAAGDFLLNRPKATLEVERVFEERQTLGLPGNVTLRVVNSGHRSLRLHFRDIVPIELGAGSATLTGSVAAGATGDFQYPVEPKRRGDHEIGPLTVQVAGPLGLTTRQFQVAGQALVRVYPNLKDLPRPELRLRRGLAIELGLHQSSWRGLGTEFDSLRDYVPDDEWRHINWKATSRRGRPITNQFTDERTQNIFLAIDNSRLLADEADGRLDAVIKSAVMLSQVALNKDDRVGLAVFNERTEHFLPPRKGTAQLSAIIDTVYSLQGRLVEPDYRSALAQIAAFKRRSLVVLFSDLLEEVDEALAAGLAELRRRHLVLALFIGDDRTNAMAMERAHDSEDVFRRATALQVLEDRRRALTGLDHSGVIVRDILPRQLTAALINQYLDIKKSGKL